MTVASRVRNPSARSEPATPAPAVELDDGPPHQGTMLFQKFQLRVFFAFMYA